MTEQSGVPAKLPPPPPPCPKMLPFGIKDANHLRRAYPLLRHGHEKAAWRLVDGLGLESADYDSMGCIVPCSPRAGVRGSVVLHCWMVEARQPDKGVPHGKLGFEALCIRADGQCREKRTVNQKLARSIHGCELWVFAMCPALRGSTVSYAGDAHFPKHSLEYSLNFPSQSKKFGS